MSMTTPRATTSAMNATGEPLISGISVAPLTVCCCGQRMKVGCYRYWLIELELTGCAGWSLTGTGVSSARIEGIVSVCGGVRVVRHRKMEQC